MIDQPSTDQPFWAFSIDVYRHKGVARSLLALQDDCGADVNMLLVVSWLASQKIVVSSELLAAFELVSSEWRRHCLHPLRALRRYLKQQEASDAMYQASKALELQAERWQQDRLYACCEPRLASLQRAEDLSVYQKNLQLYLQGLPQQQLLASLSEELIDCLNEHLSH